MVELIEQPWKQNLDTAHLNRNHCHGESSAKTENRTATTALSSLQGAIISLGRLEDPEEGDQKTCHVPMLDTQM